MKIAFIINDIKTEKKGYTTVDLALTAHRMGHEIYVIGAGELAYASDGFMTARAYIVQETKYKSAENFLKALQKSDPVTINAKDLDVLFIRNDPSDDMNDRTWAQNSPYVFGQIAMRNGVLVLNHPVTLPNSINKMYFQHFPEIIRPKTIITRDVREIEDFFKEQKSRMILKPLQGSGGKNVFLIEEKTKKNLKQIIEAISRDGYIIAQEYLPKAVDGDTRMFLMNGEPLVVNGKYAAIRRVNNNGDIRSNIHAGGHPEKAKVDDDMLRLADALRPKLIQDGMFLIGIDIVGDKLMEVNVFSPGTLNIMSKTYGVDFSKAVIQSIERKIRYKEIYGPDVNNATLAVL
ncbi:Glutathione synthetase [Fulvivirga imtechensis AK7]|uniref:Glutathione synthetase n=1 Tax=Fulvivirga imtechensis AK7 TaxID=1237149 RepID=L8JXS3_9BACT|nr:glutathione synthetase [Fulvivirga imtechensis]ELR73851.1 Glutathione synthetase [Fulvivirga imtechensis AK7]